MEAPVPSHRPPFAIGEVLGRTFGFWGRNLPMLFLLGAAVHVVPTLLHLKHLDLHGEEMLRLVRSGVAEASTSGWELAALPVEILLGLVLQVTVTYAVFQSLRGQPASMSESLRRGWRRLLPALGTALLMWLAFVAIFGLSLAPAILTSGSGSAALVALGGLVALVFIILLALRWPVAVQVAAVEDVGPATALGRSARLTQGRRGAVFVVFLVTGVVPAVVVGMLSAITMVGGLDLQALRLQVILQGALGAVIAGLTAVAAAVLYHDLRSSKEGVGIEDLLKVFD